MPRNGKADCFNSIVVVARSLLYECCFNFIYFLVCRQERKEMESKKQQAKQQTRKEHIQQRVTEKKERSIAKVSEFVTYFVWCRS